MQGHTRQQCAVSCATKDQLSLTNPCDAMHHGKRQNLILSRHHNHAYLGGNMSSFW